MCYSIKITKLYWNAFGNLCKYKVKIFRVNTYNNRGFICKSVSQQSARLQFEKQFEIKSKHTASKNLATFLTARSISDINRYANARRSAVGVRACLYMCARYARVYVWQRVDNRQIGKSYAAHVMCDEI